MAKLMPRVSRALDSCIHIAGKRALSKKSPEPLREARFDYLPAPREAHYTVGFGKSVMLPGDIDKRKYYIAGYGENNPARGVIDPQYAHALWLDDNTGRGGVLQISLDAVGLLRKDVEEAKERLSDFVLLSGCRDINIFCTHDHAGIDTMGIWGPLPLTGRDPKFMEIVFEAIRTAAFEAYRDRRAGDLYLGTCEVPDLQEDIRTPVVYSKTLTRFRFHPLDGAPEVWWLNFASHSESLQGCNHLVSADFPCYLRERIREKTGAETLYGVGAIGGMISMKVQEEGIRKQEHRLLESTRQIGTRLADYAIGISEERKLPVLLNCITTEFYVPADNPVLIAAGGVGILKAERYASSSAAKLWMLKTELTYYELGGKKILFLPCELFPELAFGGALQAEESATGKGREINPPLLCELTDDKELLIFGLVNDELGYVLPPNDFLLNADAPYLDKAIDRHGRRHYEETNSLGPQTACVVATAVAQTMEKVRLCKAQTK